MHIFDHEYLIRKEMLSEKSKENNYHEDIKKKESGWNGICSWDKTAVKLMSMT